VTDFTGNGAGTADVLVFSGYGAGATFTNIDATYWQVNYNGGTQHDVITFSNGAAVDPHDVSSCERRSHTLAGTPAWA
jgi:hypothetical protein